MNDSPTQFGIGQSVSRFEDPRLLRGDGRFVNDVNLAGQAYGVVLRSPHAHARILSIDTTAAVASPGTIAVYTADDYNQDKLGGPKVTFPRKRPDGSPIFAPERPVLVKDRVRYVGDPVAFVVAETPSQARDAAELINVDYEQLPSVTATADAGEPGKPAVWDACPDNISHIYEQGNKAATDAAFTTAARVIKRRYVITRVFAQYMEPRGALGMYDPGEDRFTLYADVQYPHRVRQVLANVFKMPESKLRVIAGDVGGGFGTKGWQYIEHRLVLWAAKKLRRPVKWSADRTEAVMGDEHGRDNISEAELALDKDNRFLALRVRTRANIGAYVGSDRNLLSIFSNVGTLAGVYTFPAAHVLVTAVLSNSNPTAPYRGAGRPEATYVIERLLDDAARELKIDPNELRRRNLIPTAALPYKNPFGVTYDCGAFEKGMDAVIRLGDLAGFPARQAESKKNNKLRGIALVNAIENAASPSPEFAEVRFDTSGTATVFMGTKAQGQAHETTFKQILVERLGVDPTDVHYIDGDTDRVTFGMGTMGSRSTVIAGSALSMAADKLIEKGKKIAGHALEAAPGDIEFANGHFTVGGTDRSIAIKEVAKAAFLPAKLPPGLEVGFFESATFVPKAATFPNGSHVCEVEVDPETGTVSVQSYCVVDDVGTVINPLTLKGQIHGGVAQGLGQALMEQVAYDRETGQLLTATFLDYCMPRADDICSMPIESNPVPTKLNPLGVKGAGEAGTVGALPVAVNAVLSALAPLGVTDIEMPVTSERVWRAIAATRR
ncbi:MAG: xanthine dehydrogenase family protein molybdopterin-binding subunit [Betaproteobacteria bacterium]|nr:xanthine dehydrogenase family protein molybdopterin-binding subunit [Betaproteobacteria bacterium]